MRELGHLERSCRSAALTRHEQSKSMEVKAVRMMLFVMAVIVGCLVLGPRPLVAHHAFSAEFDANRPVQLTGVVTRMEWVNPHSWIHVDVKKPDGTVEKWMVEGGTPNTLLRRGLRKQDLLPGTEIKVDGYQSKDGALRANGRNLTLASGRALFLGSSGTGAPRDAKDPTEPGR
jgi:uncharacterized protein DUF6152